MTALVVRWIFAQRLAGHSTARITRALNDAEAIVIPLDARVGGMAAAVTAGAVAGLLPAIRRRCLSPARAFSSI